MTSINERVKELRIALNLTLEKFGERLGVKKSTLSNIEHGRSPVTEQMLLAICREYNANEDFLRFGRGDMFVLPEDEDVALISELIEEPDNEFYQAVLLLVRTYKQLSNDSQKALLQFGQLYLENIKNRKDQ
ncbi:MAG: helix-turn-helix transcriptional regulator [Roseburia sp.]|nr:helix-turn-helix transcriptional regulator [Roseburia sp.]